MGRPRAMSLASHYLVLRTIHITAVITSGSLFLARATAGLLGWKHSLHPLLRYLSYAIDITLLSAAISLAFVLGQAPFFDSWLTVKVLLLVVYVGLGSIALKRGKNRAQRLLALIAAVSVYLFIASVAVSHSPGGAAVLFPRAVSVATVLGLGLLGMAGASVVWSALSLGIGPVPTTPSVRRALLALAPGEVRGEIHELGAGWGSLALPLADRYPKSRVVAWEASWVPFAALWLRAQLRPQANLEVRRRDFRAADLRAAGLVTCYLFPGAMERLAGKLEAELPKGAVVLSNTFALRRRPPAASSVVADLYRTHVFRYDW